MKKIKVIAASFLLSVSSILGQTKGKYDLELYQKRLSVAPRVEFGIFSEMAPFNLGFDANYFLHKNIKIDAIIASGKENNKIEIGGVFLLQNKVVSKNAKVFDKTISSSSTSETYQVLITDVNFIKMKGIRGGFYRRNFDVSVYEVNDLGYGETTIISKVNNVESSYKIGDDLYGSGSLSSFGFSTIGMYGGLYLFSARNSVNTNFQTGLNAKGRKNQSVGISADVLLGGGNLKVPKTISGFEIDEQKGGGSPVGLRILAEFSLYVGKNQNVGLMTNFEFGKYPKTSGMVGLLGFGLRINLLDKIITN